MSGYGVLTTNESTYEGEFLLNKKHGVGRLTYKDGTVKTGKWFLGTLIATSIDKDSDYD